MTPPNFVNFDLGRAAAIGPYLAVKQNYPPLIGLTCVDCVKCANLLLREPKTAGKLFDLV